MDIQGLKYNPAYASLFSNFTQLTRFQIYKFYNSLTLPHLLALSPIWQLLFCLLKQNLFIEFILSFLYNFCIYPNFFLQATFFLCQNFKLIFPATIIDKTVEDFKSSASKKIPIDLLCFYECIK